MSPVSPEEQFLSVWTARISELFPDYTVELDGDTVTERNQCPRMNVTYLGAVTDETSASRARRATCKMGILVVAYKWLDAKAPYLELIRETSAIKRVLFGSFRKLSLSDTNPFQVVGRAPIKENPFRISASSQGGIAAAKFLIQDLPIEYTIAEDRDVH